MILSPAKTMNFDAHDVADAVDCVEPIGLADADKLASLLAKQSQSRLRETLGVSDAIASENVARFKGWDEAPKRQAIVAYDGMAYDKLRGRELAKEELEVAHARLVILSGMWGPVRALTYIKPYRLEMACKKLPEPYSKLAEFWKEKATQYVLDGYSSPSKQKILLNVASDEYAKCVDFKRLEKENVRVLKADFRDALGKRRPTVHLKFGRGLLARFVITHDVNDLEALKKFDLEGYRYDDESTTEDLIVFKLAPQQEEATASSKPKKKRKTSSS